MTSGCKDTGLYLVIIIVLIIIVTGGWYVFFLQPSPTTQVSPPKNAWDAQECPCKECYPAYNTCLESRRSQCDIEFYHCTKEKCRRAGFWPEDVRCPLIK